MIDKGTASEKRDFNKDAASWDDNPGRVRVIKDVAQAMISTVPFSDGMDVLDFGCGTGLVTMALQVIVKTITGADTSEGMLAVLRQKIADGGVTNVATVLLGDKGENLPKGPFDVVVSSMTLHHMEDTLSLLARLSAVLKQGGYLCLADLDLDDGLFHENNDGVFHFGFNRAALKQGFADVGFIEVKVITATEITKPIPTGEMRKFTIFLMTGMKA